MPEQRPKVVVVTVQVVQDARRAQMAQRHGRHDLGNLLERARTARKGDERIAELDHLGLTLGHITRHDQVVDTIVLKLGLDKKARLHTGHAQGRGWFTTEFARYEVLPEMLVPAVVEQAKKLGNLDESADD